MIFSEIYKSPKSTLAAKLRLSHPHAHPQPASADQVGQDDPDLLSKDKGRQKEAVRKYLAEKTRTDWDFAWPPPEGLASSANNGRSTERGESHDRRNGRAQPGLTGGSLASLNGHDPEVVDSGAEPDSESDSASVYSTISEDPSRWRSRAEWASDISDDDDLPAEPASPFRFDSPAAIGTSVESRAVLRKAKRRRAIRSESEWNDGLACFQARRDAWTGARYARVKPKPLSPMSPTSPRKTLWRLHSRTKSDASAPPPTPSQQTNGPTSPLSPVTSNSRQSQHSARDTTTPATSDQDSHQSAPEGPRPSSSAYPVEEVVPIPKPLLPPANPMRASITPSVYTSLYDKVVTNNLQPACPVNLADMLRSCVAGWKRDGEWPPQETHPISAPIVAVKKRSKDGATKPRRDSAASLGRRLSLGGILGKVGHDEMRDAEKDHDESKGIRKSIQRVLGLGHSHSASNGSAASVEGVKENAVHG